MIPSSHPTTEEANRTVWDGSRRGLYEVYYLKFNDARSGTAYWIRYTLLAPLRGRGDPIAEVWAIAFDARDPRKNLALRETHPIADLRVRRDPFRFEVGSAFLEEGRAVGELRRGKDRIRWDLSFDPSGEPFLPMPGRLLYRLPVPKTKWIIPHIDVRFRGTVEVRGRKISLRDAPGQQTHLWGTKHAERWVWGHCNAFAEDPTAVFEGISPQIRLAGWLTPPGSFFFVRHRGAWWRFAGLIQGFRHRSDNRFPVWTFEAEAGSRRIEGEMRGDVADFVGVEYTDPDGQKAWCFNTKVGEMTLRLFERTGGAWTPAATLTSRGTTALEFTERTRDPRVAIRI